MMYAVDDKVRGEGRRQGVGHQGHNKCIIPFHGLLRIGNI